jgi:hypothetical protein
MTMMLLNRKETEKSGPPRKGRMRNARTRSRALSIREMSFQYPLEWGYMNYKVNREVEICRQ